MAYFPEGHKLFLGSETRPEFQQNLPWITNKLLPSTIIAQIVEVKFFYLDRPCCSLEIIPLVDDQIIETSENRPCCVNLDSERLYMTFYDMDTIPDFIILACRYKWATENSYKLGDLVQVLYGHEEIYSGQIIKVANRRRGLWQAYTVKWLNLEDPPEECSPWELEPLDKDKSTLYNCSEAISDSGITLFAMLILIIFPPSSYHTRGRAKRFDEK